MADLVLCIDVIEHFEKEDGLSLLSSIESLSSKRVFIFSPVGYQPQHSDDRGFGNNYFQTHRSWWHPEDLEVRGYNVTLLQGYHSRKRTYTLEQAESGREICLDAMYAILEK